MKPDDSPPAATVVSEETGRSWLVSAAAAALAAAIVGGVVWGLIARWSDYEVGIVAWAIGFLAGSAAVLGARGRRGLPLQLLAVATALVGILVGKYLGFVWGLEAAFEEQDIPVDVPIFSGDTVNAFNESRSEVFTWYDLLWVAFAVYTAFRIPRSVTEEDAAPEPVS
ncbi:MAG: hypothetical protein ABR583_11195 [Gaiellaceae bacterium]